MYGVGVAEVEKSVRLIYEGLSPVQGVQRRGSQEFLGENLRFRPVFKSGATKLDRILSRFRPFFVRVFALTFLAVSTSACTTVNITGDETVTGLTRAQKELRVRAAKLSKTAWRSVTEASFMSSIAGMLLSGKKDEAEGPGLVPDSEARYEETVVAYMEQTEQENRNAEAQLAAMIRDIQEKTQQAKALARATKSLIEDYRESEPQFVLAGGELAGASETIRGLAMVREDKTLLQDTIEKARDQESTFAIAKAAYRNKYPSADTEDLQKELQSFSLEIERIASLSSQLEQVADLS